MLRPGRDARGIMIDGQAFTALALASAFTTVICPHVSTPRQSPTRRLGQQEGATKKQERNTIPTNPRIRGTTESTEEQGAERRRTADGERDHDRRRTYLAPAVGSRQEKRNTILYTSPLLTDPVEDRADGYTHCALALCNRS